MLTKRKFLILILFFSLLENVEIVTSLGEGCCSVSQREEVPKNGLMKKIFESLFFGIDRFCLNDQFSAHLSERIPEGNASVRNYIQPLYNTINQRQWEILPLIIWCLNSFNSAKLQAVILFLEKQSS